MPSCRHVWYIGMHSSRSRIGNRAGVIPVSRSSISSNTTAAVDAFQQLLGGSPKQALGYWGGIWVCASLHQVSCLWNSKYFSQEEDSKIKPPVELHDSLMSFCSVLETFSTKAMSLTKGIQCTNAKAMNITKARIAIVRRALSLFSCIHTLGEDWPPRFVLACCHHMYLSRVVPPRFVRSVFQGSRSMLGPLLRPSRHPGPSPSILNVGQFISEILGLVYVLFPDFRGGI
jgi:hypothetical protein